MGMAWFFTGRLEKSRDSLLQALDLFGKQGDAFYQMTCAVYLTPCALYQGDFRLARQTLQRGFEAHRAIPGEIGGKAGLLLITAMTALFEGNFAEARESIDQCKELAGVHALASIELLSLTIGGWVSMARGDLDGAALLLSECKSKAARAGSAFFAGSAAHLLALTALFQNKLPNAERESNEALAIRSGKGSMLFHAIYLITSGAIHMRAGKTRRAGQELKNALRTLKQAKAVQQEANCHLVLALLERKKGNRTGFRNHLREGFSIGRDLGFTYYAVLDPEEQSELAKQAVAENICVDYCLGLLAGRKAGRPLLSIYCMGGFKVYRGSTPVRDAEWKSKRAKTMLKLLAAQEGQKLPREQAIELLWPEDAAKNPATFNAMLHRVRKVLEPAASRDVFCLQRDGDSIGLNQDVVWTDVGQFRAHLDRAARLKARNSREELLLEYERALALYQGDFLSEDVYCDWSTDVRDHLRTSYLRVLEEAGELAESAGDRDKALQFYERMFLAEPSNEKACQWLMARYQSLGRRGEAVRAYERCERALSRDMDLEPDERTKRLYRSILGT
jgi:DNA-binding SARP family transcriptional activator